MLKIKKISVVFLIIAVLTSTLFGVSVQPKDVSAAAVNTYIDSNFDTYTGTGTPTGWSVFGFVSNSEYIAGESTIYGRNPNSVKFVSTASTKVLSLSQTFNSVSKPAISEKVTLECSVQFSDTSHERAVFDLSQTSPTSMYATMLTFQADGKIRIYKQETTTPIYASFNYVANKMYKIKVVVDNPTAKASVYIDGVAVAENVQIKTGWQNINSIKFSQTGKTGPVGYMYLDDVKVATYVSTIPVQGITMETSATIAAGSTVQLNPVITPTTATNKNITWTTSNSNVATVNSTGLVTGVSGGTANITAKTEDGNFTATCQVTVQGITQQDFTNLRTKWVSKLLGGTYNLSDPQISTQISNLSTNANNLWTSMDKSTSRSYLWSGLAGTTSSADITSNYKNLYTMAKVYCAEGSTLKGNQTLLNDIIGGLEWMYINRYNKNTTMYDNWWNWEIGAPQALNNIVCLLYDKLTPTQITNYMDVVEWFQPDPTKSGAQDYTGTNHNREAVGGNRVDVSKVVGIRGLIVNDSKKIFMSRDALSQVFDFVQSGDGFYEDGSFVQHEDVPYTLTYGNVLLNGVAELIDLYRGSKWEVVDPDVNNIYNMISKAFEPLIYNGIGMDMVNGRAISRGGAQDHGVGHSIISSVLLYTKFAPTQFADKFKSMVKGWITRDTYRSYIDSQTDITLITMAKELMSNPSVIASNSLVGHFRFYNMDRVVHRRDGFGLGISMYSKRIQSYEDMNNENRRGFHTGDGMTYLYNGDQGQFSGDFWPTVNPYRLPGTTVDVKTLNDGDGEFNSPQSWVGGSSMDGLYGATGMFLDKKQRKVTYNATTGAETVTILDPLGMDLQAKKSWFTFDNEVVALGAGINSTNGRTIESIVENRKIKDTGDNVVTVNGVAKSSQVGWNSTLSGTNWVHLQGNVGGDDIGYYFPNGANLKALTETRTGAWSDINYAKDTTPISRNYFTMWFDHGTSPVNAAYQYVMLPNMDKNSVQAYSSAPQIQILANNANVQAVKETTLNITGANFWTDTVQSAGLITVNKQASVMLKETAQYIDVSISDPTMENTGTISVEIAASATAELLKNPAITVTQLGPTIKFTVNVNGAHGKEFKARFSK